MQIIDVLRRVSFGQRVAEEEGDSLAAYFVETDQWQKVFSDQVDVVYGPKGSGKSALYFLLLALIPTSPDRINTEGMPIGVSPTTVHPFEAAR